METKKYELTKKTKKVDGHILYRIRALKDICDAKKGDLGGWIESEANLSQDGVAWIYDKACVYGNAKVYENAEVRNIAHIYGDAQVHGDCSIWENAQIFDNSQVYGNSIVRENSQVYGNAKVYGEAYISSKAIVCDHAEIGGQMELYSGTFGGTEKLIGREILHR